MTHAELIKVKTACREEITRRKWTRKRAGAACDPPLTQNQVVMALDPFRAVPSLVKRLATGLGVSL